MYVKGSTSAEVDPFAFQGVAYGIESIPGGSGRCGSACIGCAVRACGGVAGEGCAGSVRAVLCGVVSAFC